MDLTNDSEKNSMLFSKTSSKRFSQMDKSFVLAGEKVIESFPMSDNNKKMFKCLGNSPSPKVSLNSKSDNPKRSKSSYLPNFIKLERDQVTTTPFEEDSSIKFQRREISITSQVPLTLSIMPANQEESFSRKSFSKLNYNSILLTNKSNYEGYSDTPPIFQIISNTQNNYTIFNNINKPEQDKSNKLNISNDSPPEKKRSILRSNNFDEESSRPESPSKKPSSFKKKVGFTSDEKVTREDYKHLTVNDNNNKRINNIILSDSLNKVDQKRNSKSQSLTSDNVSNLIKKEKFKSFVEDPTNKKVIYEKKVGCIYGFSSFTFKNFK